MPKTGQITTKRLARLTEEIAPLMVQGLGCRRIAERTGYAKSTVAEDQLLVKQLWAEQANDSRDEWRGRVLAQYEWMIGELAEAWTSSKQGRITRVINPDGTELIRQEPPDPRWLSGMLAVAKETSTFLGIREGADTVSRVEVPESTRQALAPMSNDAYLAMIATSGGLSINAVPPVPQQQQPEPIEAVEVDCLNEQEETPTVDGDEPPRQSTANRRFIPRR